MDLSLFDQAIYAYMHELDRLRAALHDRDYIRTRYDYACAEVEQRLVAMEDAKAAMMRAFAEEAKA